VLRLVICLKHDNLSVRRLQETQDRLLGRSNACRVGELLQILKECVHGIDNIGRRHFRACSRFDCTWTCNRHRGMILSSSSRSVTPQSNELRHAACYLPLSRLNNMPLGMKLCQPPQPACMWAVIENLPWLISVLLRCLAWTTVQGAGAL
jgi:hypothetical protein